MNKEYLEDESPENREDNLGIKIVAISSSESEGDDEEEPQDLQLEIYHDETTQALDNRKSSDKYLITNPLFIGNCLCFGYIKHNPVFVIGPHCKYI